MGIVQFPVPIPVTNGNLPSLKMMVSTDNLATITAAGYLNAGNIDAASPMSNTDVVMCLYSYSFQTTIGTFGLFTVTITNGSIQLVSWANPGDVLLPVAANHIAQFNGTTGQIYDGSATAIHGGSIQAGLSGTAGTLISYPAAASKGSFVIAGVANTGNTNTTLSNDAMGQASVISIPDPANAAGQLLIGATATPFVSGNFPQNSGTAGLMVDSGIAVSSLATTSNAVLLTPAADQTITLHNLAVSHGNLTAGSSGNAGTLASFSSTASRGSLIVAAVANTGNTNTTISNAAMGQATVVSIPDPGAATANFVLDTGTTTMTAGSKIVLAKVNGTEAANAVTASGMSGVITTSSLTTAGGASYAITWTNTFITSTSTVLLSIQGGTNTTENITLKVAPGSSTATLTIYNNTAATALNGTILIGYVVF